jgi:hypothetical protein
MSSKNLYINGCSFTYGYKLPKEQTWPELLSKKLNLNLINESKNGQSFQSITFNSINTLSELNPENTIVIVGLTWETRYMIQFGNETLDVSPSCLNSEQSHEVKNVFAKYYKYLVENDKNLSENQHKNLITNLISLQSFLKQNKFKYRIVNFLDQSKEMDLPIYNKLDKSKIINFRGDWRDLYIDDTSHPTKEGCVNISEVIYDSFNR